MNNTGKYILKWAVSCTVLSTLIGLYIDDAFNLSFTLAGVVLGFLIPVIIICNKIDQKEQEEQERKRKLRLRELQLEREKEEEDLINRLGQPLICKEGRMCNHLFKIYDQSKVIIINEVEIPFSLLRGCQLVTDGQIITSEYTGKENTNTGSMVGRAIVGGVLTGGAGAIIGGATASKRQIGTNTSVSQSKYSVIISMNDLKNPTKIYDCNTDLEFASDFANTINLIIENER